MFMRYHSSFSSCCLAGWLADWLAGWLPGLFYYIHVTSPSNNVLDGNDLICPGMVVIGDSVV